MDSDSALDIAQEALRQSELMIEDTNHLATSADQRAMALAATLATVASLLVALGGATPAPFFAYLSSAGFIVASFMAASSCMPRDFHIRGHWFRDWKGHIDDNDRLIDALSSQAKENDDRIDKNYAALKVAGKSTRRAFPFSFCVFAFFAGSQLGGVYLRMGA
ncbi:MAG: hypothetical protein ACU0BK_04245 [Shimia sp.]|uniref:hypothetical protein n=1 Tax=Shimia sp. TaxID=1954381 RepID=UPI004059779B